jgi:uncharacterized membrane protein YhaH (DUF805 family)
MTKIYDNHQDLELKDFFRFEGRINRSKYIDIWGWNFTVRLTFLLSYIMFNTLGAQSNSDTLKNIGIISLVFFGLTLLVGAVSLILNGMRRAHDCNQSGWFSIIPIYNIYLIWFKKGTEGENEYGNNPLEKELSENPLDEAKFKKHKKIEHENIDNQVKKKNTTDSNYCNLWVRIYWYCIYNSTNFFRHFWTNWELVSTLLRTFSNFRTCYYDWTMANEEVGCIYIHRICWTKSNSSFDYGNLEY